ncbi:MAG: hypothetical protein HYX83_01030 [Chloroflexi bacterium]|nr:hypothetical protein [Chloroflexota bacterium]
MLAHFLEEEGVPTTQISLVRLHTEIIKPPRALWVPFELGRPLGIPDNPSFQKRVLVTALKLLEVNEVPVLADFPDNAPDSKGESVLLACPYVPPPEEKAGTGQPEQLRQSLKAEMTSMRPWYDQGKKKHGRTTVGISKLTPEAIVEFLNSFLGGEAPQNPRQDISLAYELRYVVDDLKAYYYEAITAQPGAVDQTSEALDKWFWGNTVAGKVLRAIRETCLKSEDESLRRTGGGQIVPARLLR